MTRTHPSFEYSLRVIHNTTDHALILSTLNIFQIQVVLEIQKIQIYFPLTFYLSTNSCHLLIIFQKFWIARTQFFKSKSYVQQDWKNFSVQRLSVLWWASGGSNTAKTLNLVLSYHLLSSALPTILRVLQFLIRYKTRQVLI